ncbi:hypothetical protein P3W85_03360 [Cupriavidus basilensis]|uniref:Uncharacterized protein n=1 Tax=Cupriavidus basilensis TaxID=68895 RepID=A0ABT6AHB3_9BURK|nr:hypothetical protein [Cupriavidus basilensis]MDF3831998.1 hypothetical protein [Cupriavidus basilensis]
MLSIDAHCDHPFFWWSLPAIVAIGNAAAILRTNRRHHCHAFTSSSVLARHHLGTALTAGGTLFLLAGWTSGFLPDITGAISGAHNVSMATPGSIALAVVFGLFSFAHAGALHAWLCFRSPAPPNQMKRTGCDVLDRGTSISASNTSITSITSNTSTTSMTSATDATASDAPAPGRQQTRRRSAPAGRAPPA